MQREAKQWSEESGLPSDGIMPYSTHPIYHSGEASALFRSLASEVLISQLYEYT